MGHTKLLVSRARRRRLEAFTTDAKIILDLDLGDKLIIAKLV